MSPANEGSGPEFADVLRDAVRARGLSLDRIRARLAASGHTVSVATLSHWQTGRALPARSRSLEIVDELENLLRVAPGSLSSLVAPDRRRRDKVLESWEKAIPSYDIAAGIISDLGLQPNSGLSRVSIHDTTTIDARRTEVEQFSRHLLRATRSGVQRWPAVFQQDADEGVVPTVAPVSGCSLGQAVTVPERNLLVAEMILPRPLKRGELFLAEMVTTWGPTTMESFRLDRSAVEPSTRELVLEVRFHPRQVPVRAWSYFRNGVVGEEHDVTPLPICGPLVQRVWQDVPPAFYGVGWAWDWGRTSKATHSTWCVIGNTSARLRGIAHVCAQLRMTAENGL